MLTVRQIINHPVTSNCFVLSDKAIGNDCVIVDPGSKHNEELLCYIEKQMLTPKYIILTHEHFDHCWGVNELVERFQIPIVCSELCAKAIKSEKRNCSVFYDNKEQFTINSETISVESIGFILHFADSDIRFYSTPGHTEASICFVAEKYLFTGDTLIYNLPTVTKLPSGSVKKLKESLEFLQTLSVKGLQVCAGHIEVFMLETDTINRALKT